MKVRVYWNRHRKNWSVLKYNKGWRVFKRLTYFSLFDAIFTVKESGRQRCLLQNKRNVYAWIEGEFLNILCQPMPKPYKIYYNPFKMRSFRRGGKKINKARWVDFVGKDCYAY
jgi:hypothetical protein